MPNYFYVQQVGGEEKWKPIPAAAITKHVEDNKPTFVTVLAVSKIMEGLEAEDVDKLTYAGPMYFDFDSKDLALTLRKANQFLDKLSDLGVDLSAIRIFATGAKGFHVEIPHQVFTFKLPKAGIAYLPTIYREVALELYVDTLDFQVYSQRRGRMWRVPGNLRDNGKYKVPLTVAEMRGITLESYKTYTGAPRSAVQTAAPVPCVDLTVIFDKCRQKVEDRIKARGKIKRDPNAKIKAGCTSIQMLMAGIGIKDGTGFHEIALQVAVSAATAGLTLPEMLEACQGLIDNHESDGTRYDTPAKRRVELSRMHAYCQDNPCYQFSVGAVKTLLSHVAPDLDGLPASESDINEGITEAKELAKAVAAGEIVPDEFEDTSGGVTLSKFGVYVDTELGKKRICAVSFRDIHLLMSTETGQLSGYEAEVLVNGRPTGRQTMEIDTFSSVQIFNRFAARLGHALQGVETHVRGLMMRFVELAKKKGRMRYIAKREGLDVINIPNHEDKALREPFMVWADSRGIILDPRITPGQVDMSFQGFPDPRGLFKSDLADAPPLAQWIESPENRERLKVALTNLFTCQRSEVISKMLGWYTASIYRMIFHKAYGQFPILHVNGAAGSGKTSCNITFMSLFYYNQDPKVLTPSSSLFAVTQHMAGSASIPLILDEYKPQDMGHELHSRFKLMIRDAYNCRPLAKGGGTRDMDDYRKLHETNLAAPLVVVAEAAEEEAAVSERVVLVTMIKPPTSVSTTWAVRYQNWNRERKVMTVLGQWLVGQAISTSSVDNLRTEFDPMYTEARQKYLLNEGDASKNLSPEELSSKQNAKERSVFNFTVAKFGLAKFRYLIEKLYGDEFKKYFDDMSEGIYTRMSDLQSSTQAEWAKVLSMMSTMSHHADPESSVALNLGQDYAFIEIHGQTCIEIAMRSSYLKYRAFCRSNATRALFGGDQAFLHSIKDCPALEHYGKNHELDSPGTYTFRVEDLVRLGVEPFKC